MAQHVPILQHLDLSSCFLLQDVGLHNISSSLHNLRTLRLAWCKSITNLGLLGLQANGLCPVHDPVDSQLNGECSCSGKSKFPVIFRKPTEALREKNEATVKRMIAELNDAFVPQSLSALTYLQNLDLSSCPQLTDLGLRGAIKFCELRVLKMNLLHGLTDEGLTDIAINNPGLEELQVTRFLHVFLALPVNSLHYFLSLIPYCHADSKLKCFTVSREWYNNNLNLMHRNLKHLVSSFS